MQCLNSITPQLAPPEGYHSLEKFEAISFQHVLLQIRSRVEEFLQERSTQLEECFPFIAKVLEPRHHVSTRIWSHSTSFLVPNRLHNIPLIDDVAKQSKVRSMITVNTPISGFYGPGSWWATLGMTHAHSLLRWPEAEGWDYDLMSASGYMIAAAIDLILKARTIAQLGDRACESPLLPALLCAERVVSVVTGSSLFTICSYLGRPARLRRVVVVIIPLIFGLVASCFSLWVCRALFPTDTQLCCKLCDGSTLEPEDISFALPHPASIIGVIILGPVLCLSTEYWLASETLVIMLIRTIVRVGGATSQISTADQALEGAVYFSCIILGLCVPMGIIPWATVWPGLCGLFGLGYIVAFRSFPITEMSAMDMDQLAAFLGLGFVAAFRSGPRILETAHDRRIRSCRNVGNNPAIFYSS
ncbi:hypothetical protein C8R45DRAFT_931308 [Mycena sanguinolenta]|nr:hypothetical protein C8R45DRAFT_931308 [Mycena sanguinolenta]